MQIPVIWVAFVRHAMECRSLSCDMIKDASARADGYSVGAQSEATSLAKGSVGTQVGKQYSKLSIQPSVHAHFPDEGLKQRFTQINHDALVVICKLSLALSTLNSVYWTCTIHHLNKKIDRWSGSQASGVLVPAESVSREDRYPR